MGAIVRLQTKPDRLRRDQAEELRQALLPFEDQMPGAVRELIGHIDRQTASRERWTFVMLSPEQNAAVVRHLVHHSKRPLVAVQLWALCFEHLRHDTGEIMLTRQEIADKLGQKPPEVSAIMSELAEFGAIIRAGNTVIHVPPGAGGRKLARYFMNPRVATHLAGRERDDAQAEAPLLKLMEGGKVG
jgi:CRP-like cAMP-binding protein